MNRVFSHYEPYKGAIDANRKGVLVSNSDGETAAYALWNLEERGTMFVGSGEKTYQGMIIGENARQDDLDVNPMKAKQLTNVRASGKDEAIRLTPPAPPHARTGHRLHRGGRAGGGDAEIDPPAQAGAEPELPQEARAGGLKRLDLPREAGEGDHEVVEGASRAHHRRSVRFALSVGSAATSPASQGRSN